ncbi:putative ArsR family transcriptional regulator [Hamadaea flava]|uniref:Helix-turn-helix transcriptional regulator n=1 Tax=Hamadaea flava TaxID=1742688 RepID=A0ABV8LVX6_9ACTN|nr:helix-turn-helix domain-containing protein [Hamadaea flava]MCP2329250.1 putative ArsR family transcriptional regulator [Hamadaea flava]
MAEHVWQSVSALADPVRRALFDHVRRQHRPVTREEAADACGVSRNLAAFHLDKLAETGLLRTAYEAPADRPRGRGRTPKVYSAGDDLEVAIPPRRYELIASVLAAAVAREPAHAGDAAREEAYARGRAHSTPVHGLAEAVRLLDELGFEPAIEPGSPGDSDVLVLRNCPFHALVAEQTELVCGLNHAYVEGVLSGDPALAARLAPRPDACCVEVCQRRD